MSEAWYVFTLNFYLFHFAIWIVIGISKVNNLFKAQRFILLLLMVTLAKEFIVLKVHPERIVMLSLVVAYQVSVLLIEYNIFEIIYPPIRKYRALFWASFTLIGLVALFSVIHFDGQDRSKIFDIFCSLISAVLPMSVLFLELKNRGTPTESRTIVYTSVQLLYKSVTFIQICFYFELNYYFEPFMNLAFVHAYITILFYFYLGTFMITGLQKHHALAE